MESEKEGGERRGMGWERDRRRGKGVKRDGMGGEGRE